MASPFRILLAAVAAAVLVFVLFKTAIMPRYAVAGIAIGLWAAIRWWSTKSAAEVKARHQQELEKLKHTPVLKIDE
jgi:hypothetical protein